MERYRTRIKTERRPDLVRNDADLVLLQTPQTRRWLASRMANAQVTHTTDDTYDYPMADNPGFGQIAIMNRDERQSKYGKPIALFDHTPGKTPLMIVGSERDHWEALKEQADETRHYKKDQVQRHSPAPGPREWMQQYADWEETIKWKKSGKHSYSTTRGVI